MRDLVFSQPQSGIPGQHTEGMTGGQPKCLALAHALHAARPIIKLFPMSYSCPIFDGTCDVYDHSIMIIILSVVGMVTAFIVMTASGKSFFFQLALQPFLHAGNYYP